MSRSLQFLAFALFTTAGMAQADTPDVAVDIAPLHSLVARVMTGAGTPDLIIPAGVSPHAYSMRPSEAAALERADLVFWIGPDLTPWLGETISTLAPDAQAVALIDIPGTRELPIRENALFEAHQRGETTDDHDHSHDLGEDEHHHEGHDPHSWLDPQNAAVWLGAIAENLAQADPENAELYRANANAAQAEIGVLAADIDKLLGPVRGRHFIVFHDAYQYFETAFDLPADGAISVSDASRPSPARLDEIRKRIAEAHVTCILSEPQFNPDMVAAVADGIDVRTGILDPLGSDLAPGASLYPQLMRNLAQTLADCL